MSKYKLHAVTVLVNTAKSLKDMLIPIVILLVTNGFNFTLDYKQEGFFQNMIPLFIFALVFIWIALDGFIRWVTFSYWFEGNELRVQYGLFVKKKRFIPFERIQSLNYKEGIFHRVFGLVQVTVETAGSTDGKPEASLTAITRDAANQIEREMNNAKHGTAAFAEEVGTLSKGQVIHKMSAKDLIILATTSSGVGVIILGVLAALSQFAQYIPFDWFLDEFAYLVKYSAILIISLVFMGMLAAWMLSIALTMLNYYDFTVIEENDRLIITRGLLEKKRLTIPLNRVQAIKIVENPFRQLFGLATVQLESAGSGFNEGADKKIILFPLISKKKLTEPLMELFPQFDFTTDDMEKSPKRARPFFYRIDLLWMIPVIAIPTYFWFPYGLFSLLIVIPVILLGTWQHRTVAIKQSELQLTVVSRLISRATFLVQKHRIQAMEQRQSYFQKRRDIASIKVTVMSSLMGASTTALHLDREDAEHVMRWYEHKEKNSE